MIKMTKCNFTCFFNSYEQPLEIGVGEFIQARPVLRFLYFCLGKTLCSLKEMYTLLIYDESVWEKKKGKVKEYRLGGRFSPICFRIFNLVLMEARCCQIRGHCPPV